MILKVFCMVMGLTFLSLNAEANGRQPCDRGAGGIRYCVGQKFLCHDGRISRSHKVCNPSIHGSAKKNQDKR